MNKVLLFAHLKEIAGQSSLEIDAAGQTVQSVRDTLVASLGNLDGVMIAVNEEFATDEIVIQAGDEIALIPPVSGG
ncbi:molybdopterin converting factor subunit 1 [Lederbergia galactosidilytica]|uniref:Molybdopterin synthase sulfur carrier subunit n=1 Tax=Lederbergia galactosidilytica TaxID=217031 RepID=A0A0Q9Y2S7_9BACI|nr:molybdopterin converting factor subunit 1 [Lederbergia galactosidilytica]KRG11314.1 molybdenum cofactor biosynthesis protein MoaD [Lederbergia galactosidilytica]KRG15884.1 molybdenum cofactor biosynthesis protein MoaD [Virgibacillus soli]MBP1915578.1 molybdopterin synthase sulfur carrier subunit [Lederbergia galactosidilytica]OAK67510.1 molybdenum cofactor biosynthesis protein MoaD [Lederbergia galactosidilytica]